MTLAERQVNLMIFDSGVSRLQDLETPRLAKKPRLQVRVIAISGDLSFETREALVQEGVIYQMQKPAEPGRICRVVLKIIAKLHKRA